MKVEPILVSNLLKLAHAYANYHECTLANVGRRIHNDNAVFARLEAGTGSITLRKYDEVIERFRDKWPRGLRWPRLREPFA